MVASTFGRNGDVSSPAVCYENNRLLLILRFFYVSIFSWLFLMLIWLNRLSGAIALYDAIFILPLLQSNFIFFAIVSGGIYFKVTRPVIQTRLGLRSVFRLGIQLYGLRL